jgi:transcriptional regulator with XRE-family HTH domain
LAKKLDIPHSSLFNYLYDDITPRYESLMKIADYFHVPISDFLEENQIITYEVSPEEYELIERYRKLGKERKDVIQLLLRFDGCDDPPNEDTTKGGFDGIGNSGQL